MHDDCMSKTFCENYTTIIYMYSICADDPDEHFKAPQNKRLEYHGSFCLNYAILETWARPHS